VGLEKRDERREKARPRARAKATANAEGAEDAKVRGGKAWSDRV
jgi:hypothetical protein